MRFIGNDDDITPFGKNRVSLALVGAKLLNQREDIAVILRKQLPQVFAAFRLGVGFGYNACRGEMLVDLPVQFLPVGDHHKCPVPRHLAQHFLGEEHHRHTLAAALRMPEHPQLAVPLSNIGQGFQCIINAQVLMVLGCQLD